MDDDQLLALLPGDAARTHGERLPGEIARALEAASITRDRIDLLAVAAGPGAFTGLRIGLAAMQGLALALRTPVIGVSALDALAEQARTHATDRIVPWMDAQRGDVFATIIDVASGAHLEPPTTAAPAALLSDWRSHFADRSATFIGDAVPRDAAAIDASARRATRRMPESLAPQIGRLARLRAAQGAGGHPHALEPIYVRRPDAEIERERNGR